jgi:hypothetical protein
VSAVREAPIGLASGIPFTAGASVPASPVLFNPVALVTSVRQSGEEAHRLRAVTRHDSPRAGDNAADVVEAIKLARQRNGQDTPTARRPPDPAPPVAAGDCGLATDGLGTVKAHVRQAAELLGRRFGEVTMSGISTSVRRAAVAFAAVVTVCLAIGMDLLAGEHPVHTATLGFVVAAVAAVRVRLAGRYSGCFSALGGAIVAQPALHGAMKLLPADPDPVGHTIETSVSVVHVVLTAAVVAVVAGAQGLFLLLAAAYPIARVLLLLVRLPARPRPRPVVRQPAAAGERLFLVADVSRRGPPAVTAAVPA